MSDGLMLPPGQGRSLGAGITLKVGTEQAASASSFEIIVPPGYDVGAHVHARQEELFYILEGELDLFAFEPVTRTDENWRIIAHRSAGIPRRTRIPDVCSTRLPSRIRKPGNGSSPYALPGCPAGHEGYFEELLAILKRGGPPDPEVIAALRKRYDIEQLTPLIPGQGFPQS